MPYDWFSARFLLGCCSFSFACFSFEPVRLPAQRRKYSQMLGAVLVAATPVSDLLEFKGLREAVKCQKSVLARAAYVVFRLKPPSKWNKLPSSRHIHTYIHTCAYTYVYLKWEVKLRKQFSRTRARLAVPRQLSESINFTFSLCRLLGFQ